MVRPFRGLKRLNKEHLAYACKKDNIAAEQMQIISPVETESYHSVFSIYNLKL